MSKKRGELHLRTLPFSGTGTLKFYALYGAKGKPHANARVNLTLRDAMTNEVLQNIISLSGIKDTLLDLSVPIEFAGRSLQLAVNLEGVSKSVAYRLERWMVDAEDSSSLPSKTALKKNESGSLLPNSYGLEQNYPNPFNPETIIRYQLPVAAHVSIKVYDVLGREVAALVDEPKEAGYYEVTLDASQLSSGVYLYRMTTGNYSAARKFVVMK